MFWRSLVESDSAAGAVAKSTQIFLKVKGGSIMEIFRAGEIEIKETLIAVVLNSANCTVLTVQLTIAKLGPKN